MNRGNCFSRKGKAFPPKADFRRCQRWPHHLAQFRRGAPKDARTGARRATPHRATATPPRDPKAGTHGSAPLHAPPASRCPVGQRSKRPARPQKGSKGPTHDPRSADRIRREEPAATLWRGGSGEWGRGRQIGQEESTTTTPRRISTADGFLQTRPRPLPWRGGPCW